MIAVATNNKINKQPNNRKICSPIDALIILSIISDFGNDTPAFRHGEELPFSFLMLNVIGSFDTREYLVRNYQTC